MLQGHKRSPSVQPLIQLKDLINHPERITLGRMTSLDLSISSARIFQLFVKQLPKARITAQF